MSSQTVVVQAVVTPAVENLLALKKQVFDARIFWVHLKEEYYQDFATDVRTVESLALWTLVHSALEQYLSVSKRYDSAFAEFVALRSTSQ